VQFTLIVFSHLRWDFVFQRPQHLLSRLASRHPVVYIEEPLPADTDRDSWELSRPMDNVLVARPRLADLSGRSDAEQTQTLFTMVQELVASQGITQPVAWMYTPMAEPLIDAVEPALIVYDCMDELSLFLGAPPALLDREAALIERADLVFTGGVSLYEAKRHRHPHVSCFPSSVDAAHFSRARPGSQVLAEPPDQATLPRPRLGYFGVVDERIDLPILDALGAAHREWQIVVVGPVVKIDPATLPRHPNMLYTGQRGYDDLPAYLSGWDVCLLPFARNDATRFISPTKTLEYMAAERPIVSTPIADVVNSYAHIVYLADSPSAFVAACESALSATPAERERRTADMRRVVAGTSWDTTTSRMEQLIDNALAGQLAPQP
jgi:UDP-galactopyranose mutase